MRSRRLLAATLLIAACAPAGVGPDDRGAQVDALFAQFDEEAGPGLSVAVIQNGEVVFSNGYGLAELEHRIAITPSTVFDIASVSKQFAGLTVSMLIEEGRISLDDDVRTYIPELHDFGPTITIDHLLHHTGGVRDWPGTLAVAGWQFDDVISFEQILDFAFQQRSLNFVPGAEYTYSNTGYNLLAETVARVSGQSFRTWTDEYLFGPLGMTSSHFQDTHTQVVPNRARGYAPLEDGGFAAVTDNLTALGSSSLFSTVEDLAKWVANFETGAVGGRAAMDRTRTRGVLNDGSEIAYAFGISHGEHRGLPTLSHGGSWAAFRTHLVHFPEQRLGVVLLANHPFDAGRAALQVADIYLADVVDTEAGESEDESATTPVQVADATLDRYTGTFRLGPGWYVEIRREDGGLVAQATDEASFPMTPRSETDFWVEAYGASMTFSGAGGGPAPALEYRGNRAPRVAPRPPPSLADLASFVGEYESAELGTSYAVALDGDRLVMRHPRHGEIELTHAFGGDFKGSQWFMGSVEFTRNRSGFVDGFLVNQMPRSRDIRFTRREP